ncbi:hypothetical protein Nepgr_011401 [Nepenthes gracilis]|uniref:Uncharacterized protein n=1 Tax=Nepenthes gracilis TaxID=150966 RepID=A0AAD3SE02_NEPGR|nr:hypothetical protein Nepgr_011401 [Nepenthes gracilis]
MAAAPAKSPLHNFPLPFLKWGSRNPVNSHQRCRRPVESPPLSTENIDRNNNRYGRSSTSDMDYEGGARETEAESESSKVLTVGSRTARDRFSFVDMTLKQQQGTLGRDREREESVFDGDDRYKAKAAERESDPVEVEADASPQKPWNLRPRRPTNKTTIEIGGGGGVTSKNGEFHEQIENLPKSMRLRGFAESGATESREKRKFWITLPKDEIEEDIYALTGSKPVRRPRKRTRTVQKQLDNVFPGLLLVGVSPEAYRGLDAQLKR